MDTKQKVNYRRHCTNFDYLEANEDVFKDVEALLSAKNEYGNILKSLAEALNMEEAANVKQSTEKGQRREAANGWFLTIASALFALADKRGDATLKQQSDYKRTRINGLKEGDFVPEATALFELAKKDLTDLAPYGVSEADNKAFGDAIEAYRLVMNKPRVTKAEQTRLNARCEALLKEADVLFKNQLDRLLQRFATSHPDFFAGYQRARSIVDAASRSTQLKVEVLHAKDKTPLAKAAVSLDGKELTIETDERGRVVFKDIEPGTYKVTITRQGFSGAMQEGVVVKMGKVKSVKVGLVEG